MRAKARQQLVSKLLADRHLLRQQLRREQALDEVVHAAVSISSRKAEHTADGVRLEHGARDVRRRPEPVDRGPALEVERRERPFRADPLEDLRSDVDVLGEDGLLEARRVQPPRHAVPRQLARRQQRESFVVGLEELAPYVEELLAPRRVVVGDARVQHEVVVPARDRQRVELDRAEPPEDLEHRLRTALDEARGRKQMARDEEASCGVGRDLHRRDASGGAGDLARAGGKRDDRLTTRPTSTPTPGDPELTELAARLVAIDSVNPDLITGAPGERDAAAFVAEWCAGHGLDIEVVGDERPSVIATKRGSGGGRSLLLNGHLDTVGVVGMEAPHEPRADEALAPGDQRCHSILLRG